jgi:hypothetical protein
MLRFRLGETRCRRVLQAEIVWLGALATTPMGALQRLAVDGDEVGRAPGQRRHPADEAALELLGIEHGEEVAQVIMRGRAVRERPEVAQQGQLLLVDQCLTAVDNGYNRSSWTPLHTLWKSPRP